MAGEQQPVLDLTFLRNEQNLVGCRWEGWQDGSRGWQPWPDSTVSGRP